MVEDWAGTAGWCLSLVTGAGRSGGGRLGQQDFGAKVGPEMRARVRGLSVHAERYVWSGGGSSCGSLRPPSSCSAAPTSGLPEG